MRVCLPVLLSVCLSVCLCPDRWAISTVRYEVEYEECYEPYVIASRRLLPRYDERFHGYGSKNVILRSVVLSVSLTLNASLLQ